MTLFGLIFAAFFAGLSGFLALREARRDGEAPGRLTALRGLVLWTLAVSVGLILLRWSESTGEATGWRPIEAHADGLLLIAGLLTWCSLWCLRQGRSITLAGFLLLLVAGLNAWAACPANWRPFNSLEPLWHAIHLLGVSLGTAGAAVAASGGAMYLITAKRLKRKQRAPGPQRLSLETLEKVIVGGATVGFVLLTVGIVSGGVMISKEPGVLGTPFYASIKFWIAVITWAGYGLLMNARVTPQLRGRYAAWVAIAGLLALLIVYGVFTVVPDPPADTPDQAPAAGIRFDASAVSSSQPEPSASSTIPFRGRGVG